MNLNKLLLLAFLLSIQLVASGQTITLTLDNVPSNTLCNEIWTEQNLDLSFVTGTSDDWGEDELCFFVVEPTYVFLAASRLTVDLSSLQNIQKVEVDINDWCNTDCTQAFLIDSSGVIVNSAGNTLIQSTETLIIENPTEGFLSELAISSGEGQVHEIRIYQNDELSTDQIELDDQAFTIYPNPVIDIIKIDVSGSLKYEATIFDLQGRIMISEINQPAIDIQTLPQGTYLIEIKDLDSGQKVIEKIIKR